MQLLQEKPCWKDNDNKCRGVIQLSKIATRRTSVCWNLVVMELMHFIYQLMSVPRKRILLVMDFNHVHSTDFGGISHQPYFSTCANAHGIQSKHKQPWHSWTPAFPSCWRQPRSSCGCNTCWQSSRVEKVKPCGSFILLWQHQHWAGRKDAEQLSLHKHAYSTSELAKFLCHFSYTLSWFNSSQQQSPTQSLAHFLPLGWRREPIE